MRCMIGVAGRPVQFVDAIPDGRKDSCDSCGRPLFANVVASACLGTKNGNAHDWVVEKPERADEILASLLKRGAS